MRASVRVLLSLTLTTVPCILALSDPAVTISQGKLRGRRLQTYKGKTIFAFQGIPYAKPPLGDLRFKSPEPPESWEGFRNTKQIGNPCLQREYIFEKQPEIIGDEDCLFLNVYTTQLRADATAHPVLIYIHGGGWQSGSGSYYGPEYLLDNDLVLVTFNYRLGPLGFLSTEDVNSPGNYGIKDQIAVLRWVRDNVVAFRGDPTRVTIAGQSAGGASVQYLLYSPITKGLFNSAISMSGTAMCPWASARQPAFQARRLAAILGCPEKPSEQLVSCMRSLDAKEFIDSTLSMSEWDIDPIFLFSPSVEPAHTGERAIPATMTEMMHEMDRMPTETGPWMIGFTSEDGSIRSSAISSNVSLLMDLDNNFEKVAPITLRFQETASYPADISRKIRKFYFGDKTIDRNVKKELTDLFTDRHILHPIQQVKDILKKLRSDRQIFLYQFSHRGKHSFTDIFDPGSKIDYGVCHLDEIQYIFHAPQYYPPLSTNENDTDHQMMLLTTRLLTNFIHHGHPTPSSEEFEKIDLSTNETFTWSQPTSEVEFADLRLPEPKMLPGILFEKRREFWKSLNLEEHKLPVTHSEL